MAEQDNTINIEICEEPEREYGFVDSRDKWQPVIDALEVLPKGKMLVINAKHQTARHALKRYGYKHLYKRILSIEEDRCGIVSANTFEAPEKTEPESVDDL